MKSRPKKYRKPIVPQALKTINPNVAGIDVGSSEIYVAVPPDRDSQSVRAFPTFTRDLHELAHWLITCRITTVAMESTGVYWIPLYDILQHVGIEVCLVNARHVKHVPGKNRCPRLPMAPTTTYLRVARFLLPSREEIRRLRTISRQRDMLLRYRAAHVQHMQKALHEMNIQLDNVISDITGTTGSPSSAPFLPVNGTPSSSASTAILIADAVKRTSSSHSKAPTSTSISSSSQALELYDFYTRQILDCDHRLQTLYALSSTSPHSARPMPPTSKTKKRARQDPPLICAPASTNSRASISPRSMASMPSPAR